MAKHVDRKQRRELERKHRKRDRKARLLQEQTMRVLDERVKHDMPACSFPGEDSEEEGAEPSCQAPGTHILIEKGSLAIYQQTKDRRDLRLWIGCDEHTPTMAQALRWNGVDIQVATGRALLHLGEVEEVGGEGQRPSGLILPGGMRTSSMRESGPPEADASESSST